MLPWKNGVFDTHSAFVIQVQVCKDREGNTHSSFILPSPEDESTAMQMSPSHGMVEGMCALMTQALVLETKIQVFEKMTRASEVGMSVVDFSSEEIVRTVCETFAKTIETMAPSLVRDVVERLVTEIHSGTTA